MACHDGVTAVDSHGSAASYGGGNTKMQSKYTDALGNVSKRFIDDLTVTHPIGFLYEDAEKRGTNEIVPQTYGFIAGTPGNDWNTHIGSPERLAVGETSKKIKDTLYGGWMTCATCHEVHNTINAVPNGTHSYNYFLYAKEEGSAICLSCHVK
jgi:hypothetical protein